MKKIVQTAGRNALNEFAPQFAHFNDDVLFGENWNNQDIDVKTRCIITVTALIASGIINTSLVHHFENAKAHAKKMIFPIGEPNDKFAQYFTGKSFLAPVSTSQVGIFNVTFEPGCRNNWHIHHAKSGGGQILICTAGRGYYQEEGKEAEEMNPRDCVNIPAEVKHWHGAALNEWFSHLAIEVPGEKTSSEWCETVTDEIYEKLK